MILLIVNSVISPLGGFYVSNTFEVGRGLRRDRGAHLRGGGLFNLAETKVSVPNKELECKVEKLKYAKLEAMQMRIKNKSELPAGE